MRAGVRAATARAATALAALLADQVEPRVHALREEGAQTTGVCGSSQVAAHHRQSLLRRGRRRLGVALEVAARGVGARIEEEEVGRLILQVRHAPTDVSMPDEEPLADMRNADKQGLIVCEVGEDLLLLTQPNECEQRLAVPHDEGGEAFRRSLLQGAEAIPSCLEWRQVAAGMAGPRGRLGLVGGHVLERGGGLVLVAIPQ